MMFEFGVGQEIGGFGILGLICLGSDFGFVFCNLVLFSVA